MSPGAELVIRLCRDSTAEQRIKALEVSALAMPSLHDTFNEPDFFVLSAFALGFIVRGEIPSHHDWNRMADFLNGTENNTQN